MKILINAISIKEGGALVVLKNLVNQLSRQSKNIQWYVLVCRDGILEQSKFESNVNILVFPWVNRSFIHMWYWYEVYLFRLISNLEITLLYSMTNYLSHRKMKIPSIVLEHQAGYFSREFIELMNQQLSYIGKLLFLYKLRWVKSSLQKATSVTVQTHALADDIKKELPHLNTISVIPHGSGLVENGYVRYLKNEKCIRLGYVTKYGVQKNFGVIFRAVHSLLEQNVSLKLLLTLGTNNDSQQVIEQDISSQISENIINYGEVDQKSVGDIYKQIDIFLFPSICESFGMPMVEAMKSGLPIIAADTAVNREILGNAALFFTKDDDHELCKIIKILIDRPEEYEARSKASLKRSELYSWEKSAVLNLDLIMSTLEKY